MNRRDWMKGAAAGLAIGMETLPARGAKANTTIVATRSEWKLVYPGIWKATLGTPEPHTPVSKRLIAPAVEKLKAMQSSPDPPIKVPDGRVTTRGLAISLPLEPDEMIYGFGLQLLSLPQRGKKRIIRVNADPKGDAGDSHAPVPFYVTTRGYGILVDTFRQAEFYCGEARPKPEHSVAPVAVTVNTPQQTRDSELAKAGRVEVEIPRAAGVDVYVFAGPDTLHAVRRYNLFSGQPVLPPEWGLGFWYRPEMHLAQEEVIGLGREFRDRNIPCDVLGLEPGWQTHAYSCTFVWERQRFPDPAGFVRDAGKLGYRVNLWEHAFTHPASPLYDALLPHSGDYGVWGGLVPDFAGEAARRIFGDYHGMELIDKGVCGFKLDECDNSDFTGGWSFPDMSRFPSGLDGEQMHAGFGLRYQHAILEQFRKRGQETYGLVRSSGALAAPYPFVLYSDLYDHREFVRGLVTSGFSGLLWCPEVRDAASDEDLIRRLQTVVFSPLAMVNAWYIVNPPWKQRDRELNNANKFAENWQQLEERCREIIGWRMQLIPYLRAAFERYALDGTPPFRALALDYPDETRLRTVDDAFLVGDRVMVAPLFAGEQARDIVIPSGKWRDFWTGKLVEGNRIRIDCSMRDIPVFVKDGSILPLAGVGAFSGAQESRELTVRVYGGGVLGWELNGLRLKWSGGKGYTEGGADATAPYRVIRWQQMS